jgi:ABC-type multidrug transport system fused ATPase/permease subunit
MLNLKQKYFYIINFFSILRNLKVVSLQRILFLISIIFFVMLFDALSIISIMPLIQFIQVGQDVDEFFSAFSYGKQFVGIYNFFSVPFTLMSLSIVLLLFITMRQFINLFEIQETERTTLNIAKGLSIDCFSSIMLAKADYIRSIKQGQFTVVCESECNRASLVYKGLLQFLSTSLQIGAYATVMFYVAPLMTALAILVMTILLFSMYSFVKKSHIAGDMVVSIRQKFYNFLSENFSIWRLFKFSGSINNELNKVEFLADNYATKQLVVIKYNNLSRFFIAIIAMFLCIIFLNLSVNYFSFDLSKITLFALIFIRLIPLGQRLNGLINAIVAWAPSLFVIKNILNESKKHKEVLDVGSKFNTTNAIIEFKNVSFSYINSEDNIILNNINLTIPANKVTAIVGRSGAGKSTLIDLLPRIISPNNGTIYIDGINIKDFSLSSFRNNISFVSQDAILFDGTIKDNISYYDQESPYFEIKQASMLSGADDFIKTLPGQYDYNIGEKGQKLSGGQKQRLILARAFLSRSKILILDEATSALDHLSELHVKKAINEFLKINNSTIIIIAHRHTTIENADFVVYLDKGEVKDTGTPKYIFKKYYSI